MSVIIPVFNGAHLVAETLNSVIAQKYENFECVVVDDASTDSTVEVVSRTIQDHTAFCLIRLEKNQGRSAARNRGFEASRGDWVIFLDADDLLLPWYIATTIAYAERYDASELGGFSGEMLVGDSGGRAKKLIASPLRIWRCKRSARRLSFADLIGGYRWPGGMTNFLLKRSAFERIGGFPDGNEHAEDWHFLQTMLRHGYVFFLTGVPSYIYRQHMASTVANAPVTQAIAMVTETKRLYQRERLPTGAVSPSVQDVAMHMAVLQILLPYATTCLLEQDYANAHQLLGHTKQYNFGYLTRQALRPHIQQGCRRFSQRTGQKASDTKINEITDIICNSLLLEDSTLD